jgi:hypothetical protein
VCLDYALPALIELIAGITGRTVSCDVIIGFAEITHLLTGFGERQKVSFVASCADVAAVPNCTVGLSCTVSTWNNALTLR